MAADTVVVSYLHANEPSHSFLESLEKLIGFDLANHGRVIRGGVHRIRAGAGGIVDGRNKAAKSFLETSSPWLFIVDDDMGFAPDTVERLLQSADAVDRPVVGGLCFSMREMAPDGKGGFYVLPVPTIYQWSKDETGREGYSPKTLYPINALVRVAGTGTACLLVHRSILETIRDAEGETWFDQVVNPSTGMRISEDLSFCYRVLSAGKPVYVNTAVKTSHYKPMWVAESDYWMRYDPPPATEQTAVIVPVLNRPQNAEPFMRSLRASTGLAAVYAVATTDDTATTDAWRQAGATVFAAGDTFAQKVNVGYQRTTEPWLFLVGDDVRFRPGWLDHAQDAANTHNAAVVGTNDLGNPRVMNGDHATHLLVSRSYIDEQGASWDGPKVVCHEGYRHWFVDDEIVAAAKQRDVWAMALGSIVEHLHPAWGKADNDATYELGQAHAKEDQRLFKGRRKAYLDA